VKSSVDVIIGFVGREHNLLLGRRTAAKVAQALLRNYVGEADLFTEVRGRDLATGRPKTIVLGRDELRGAVRRS
jgi:rod shape-determining protein MreB and related proteins